MLRELRSSLRVLAVLFFVSTAVRANDSAESAWREFRKEFSYHVQSIALLDHKYLIISEPPPQVTLEGLADISPILANPRVFKRTMGVDGWLKDIVFELPPILTERGRADLLDSVHLYVFGTTYRAETLELGGLPWRISKPETLELFGLPQRISKPNTPPRLDLRVSAADLYRWTFLENEQFGRAGRRATATPAAILSGTETGIFYSSQPGLVLWVLPRELNISNRRREARQFAMDSDLILGALQGATQFAVVARERTLPTTSLPPLRFETIELLASVPRKNLAQSYERTYSLAGRINDNHHDWAPIYLSPELIDTEYGSLLNMTDQMLKSWTEAGRVRYTNFDYPDPGSFPFGKTGLADTEQTVTYNWNTIGVGYKEMIGAYPVFALNRTGALAVSYIAEDDLRLSGQEERAYRYFAQLNNPDLARVVQYAALYQIFREMKTGKIEWTPPESENPATAAMKELTLDTLRMLRDVDLSERIDPKTPDGAKALIELTACRKTLASITLNYQEEGMEDLAGRLSDFRHETRRLPLFARLLKKEVLPTETAVAAEANCREIVSDAAGRARRTKAFQAYQQAWVRPETGWVRTASVVLSGWTTMPEGHNLVGGHNLYSKITELREDPALPAGKISIEKKGDEIVIVHSKYDRAKAHELVRVAAREVERPNATTLSLRTALERELARATPVRLGRVEALGLPASGLEPRSFQQSLYSNGDASARVVPGGARFDAQGVAANVREVAANPGHVVVVKNSNGTYQLIFGGMDNPIDVKSMPALVDQMLDPANLRSNPSQMQLHLAGFTPEEGSGFMRNIELQMRRQANDDSVLTGIVEKDGNVSVETVRELSERYDFSRARLSEPRFSVIEEGPLQGGHLVEADLEIPSRVVLRPTLRMRIRIFFSARLQLLSSAVRYSLDSILAQLGSEQATLRIQARDLKREILKIYPDAKRVEIQLNRYSITENLEAPPNDGTLAKNPQAA
jgi:hypothetical protein